MKNKKDLIKDLVFNIFFGLVAVTGLVFIILHFVGDYSTTLLSEDELVKAETAFYNKMSMTYLGFGFILLGLGVLPISIYLSEKAKKYELAKDKVSKRSQRLASLEKEVVEVPAKDVEPKLE